MSVHEDISALVAVMKRERIAEYEGPFRGSSTGRARVVLHPSAFIPEAPAAAPTKPREPHPNPLFAAPDTEG